MSEYIAAIDQGTTSTRCMIFDHTGRVVGVDQREHHQIYPQPGWVEHDPREIWDRTQQVIHGVLRTGNINPSQIKALGITNQRETTIVWDRRTGQPYAPAIVWQDTRTDQICNKLAQEAGQDWFREKTGLPIATYFSGPKLSWLLENIEGLQKDANQGNALFGTVDSWLIWNLTGGPDGGVHVTDVTNGSRTLMMDLQSLDWDSAILDLLGIPRQMLPTICPSSNIFGKTKGLMAGVPLAGDLGDQQAALFGQACFSPGEAKNTYGTGCFMLLNTGTHPVYSQSGLITTLGYKIGNQPAVYCLEGSIAVTGALIQWLRDNIGFINNSSEVEQLASKVEDNGDIYIVPAFSGLFAPYWKSDARGVIVGLTRYVNRGHIARAALEATAYQTCEVFEAMEKDSKIHLQELKVDGGMVRNDLLMQFQADILNVPVSRPKITETTSLGAAYAAGLAVGFWDNLDQLRLNWKKDKQWDPKMEDETRQRLYTGWKKAVTRTFNWIE